MQEESIGRKLNKGVSTIEILIAFMVLTLCIGAIILITFNNQTSTLDLENHHEAFMLNQALWATIQGLDYENILPCDDAGAVCPGSPSPMFNRKININPSQITECAKNIENETRWERDLVALDLKFITRIIDTATATALDGDCATTPPNNDWTHPVKLTSTDTTQNTLKATGIDEKNKFVYMSVDPSLANDPDFFIFDNQNLSTTPIQISSLNTGPGLSSIDIAGSYAYVSNDSKNGQLQIIDISDPHNPTLTNTLNVVPGGTDINSVGNKVFYYDSKIFLGLKKNNYAEFYVIDATNLNILGSYEVGASINAIYVKNNYAYIATPNTEELSIVNINPSSFQFMKRVGGFDAPSGSGNGKSLQIIGNTLYLGRTVGNKEFYILDITDPINPNVLGLYDVNSSINDLVVVGPYAFLITGTTGAEIQILNISAPENILLIGKFNFADKPTNLDYADDQIFLSSENQDALTIIRPKI